jgi:hypothetical protein
MGLEPVGRVLAFLMHLEALVPPPGAIMIAAVGEADLAGMYSRTLGTTVLCVSGATVSQSRMNGGSGVVANVGSAKRIRLTKRRSVNRRCVMEEQIAVYP